MESSTFKKTALIHQTKEILTSKPTFTQGVSEKRNSKLSVASCQLSVASCELSVDFCQLSVDFCQLSVGFCQLLFCKRQIFCLLLA